MSATELKTIREILQLSTPFLQKHGVKDARRTMEEVVASRLGIERIDLYMDLDRPLTAAEVADLSMSMQRLQKREPWQYVVGSVSFYGCSIDVDSSVLIPRQETEILIDKIIASRKQNPPGVVWDVCTGSGCLAIAAKKQWPDAKVFASDICEKALKKAEQNAKKNNVEITFLQGDLLEPFGSEKADLIICNPPYICHQDRESLDPEVREYEPSLALFGGEDGLLFYSRLSDQVRDCLFSNGSLWLELGTGQKESVLALFEGEGTVESDWSGHDRFFLLQTGFQR